MRQVITRKSAPWLLPILCAIASGCAPDDFANTNSNDPLWGATPPPRPPAAPYQPTASATVPPLPSSNPTPSLAGLTAPTPRIPTDPGAPGWQAPVTTSPVVLQPPQPLTTPPAPAPPAPKASDLQLAGNVTAAPDANSLMAQLDAKTLGWRVSKTAQGSMLSIIYMDKGQQQHGEVPIVGGNYVSAMQAALDKIPPTKN